MVMRPIKKLAKIHWFVDSLERETGFEPATACLGSKNSTTELLPLD